MVMLYHRVPDSAKDGDFNVLRGPKSMLPIIEPRFSVLAISVLSALILHWSRDVFVFLPLPYSLKEVFIYQLLLTAITTMILVRIETTHSTKHWLCKYYLIDNLLHLISLHIRYRFV